ncbi:MAG: endopeptidase La [Calditrichia bacterium]
MHQDIKEFEIPVEMPILPVRNTIFFPNQFIPISVGRSRSLKVLEHTLQENKLLGIVAQRDGTIDEPGEADLYRIGTVAKVLKVIDLPDGSKSAFIQGIKRFRMVELTSEEPFFLAKIEVLEDEIPENVDEVELYAYVNNLRQLYQKAAEYASEISSEHLGIIENLKEPGIVADMVVAYTNIPNEDKQQLLEQVNVLDRLKKSHFLLNKYVQTLELGKKIQSEIQDEISKSQREMYLRQQLKAIQKELGEMDDVSDVSQLKQKIEEADLPDDVKKVVDKELDRLARMHPASAEYTVSRTYVEWLIEIPWQKSTEDNLDIAKVEQKLNEDHYDLEKVKKRILEYLAVRKLKKDMRGPILCFVGPPGVGKTSLGKSIAEAIGRKFYRMSLGGVRDEAEIRGHRRTYIGALPGRIIQGIRKAGSNNPVFMLDEIDKIGMDFRGDPASALLEVLDPEQNNSFSDHYLELPFDLSKTMFIATANMIDPIPPALKDRMEIIEIPSYTEHDKVQIAFNFLIPKQIKEHGLTESQIKFTEEAVIKIINDYTKEAGVRNLERQIAAICRNIAKDVASGKDECQNITPDKVIDILGPEKYFSEISERITASGIATGLAWTPVGGDILFIEATKMAGTGKLNLTGQLGNVMKESAEAALSYIRSHSDELGIDSEFYKNVDIHIHVPAGAIPKDGPSAGVTIFTALVSLLTDQVVANDIAMTGEITLRGKVLPVGGIKEKVLAAHRSGIKKVILPERNKADIIEIPEKVRDEMTFHFVKSMDEVINLALKKDKKSKKKQELATDMK